jgi:heat shock protein HtpX
VLWIYVASLTVAFSHIGEEILRFINRVRQLETKREKNYLIPLFEDVYAEARKIYPNLTKDIEICIVDAMYINAFALGRKTVAVTRGAVDSLSEEELSGFISHELGHIANGDTKALLLTTVGNGIFTVFILIMQLIINIMSGMFARGGIAGFVAGLIKSLFNISLFFFFYIGQFILAINSRKNEYRADEFAYEIGYGDNLVEALYLLQGMCISDNAKIVDRLKASHPHIAKRIGRLETIIDEAEENLLTE